jgi:type IV pilus assembly protein PilM
MAATTVIGLDVGTTSVRAAESSRGKDGPVITLCAELPLPMGAVVGGVIQDDKAVTAAVRRLRSAYKFHTRSVVLGVTNPQSVVREMTVANLPPKEMRASLPFQVRDMLPFPAERSVLDFLPLEDPGRNENVRGLLVAAPKEAVLTAVHAVEQAGFSVIRVDLTSLALLRGAARLDDQVEAIIDIGTQITTVVVHSNGVPLIVRTIPRGGAELTAAVSSRLAIPAAEAEERKCQVGLRSEKGADVADAVREALRPLLNEIRGSFAYLTTGSRHTQVSRLILAGGGAMLPGLPDILETQFDVEVEGADPLIRLRRIRPSRRAGSAELIPPSALIAVGLTLGTT